MNIENEDLFKHCLKEGVNLFLGSGFSVYAEGKGGLLPAGDGLKNELIEAFKREKGTSLNLAQICQVIASTQRDNLKKFLTERFTVTEFDARYKNIEKIKIKSIFTTNIDNLIFEIFSGSNQYYINDVIRRGPVISGSSAIDFIALHGNVIHEQDFDFSPLEISSSFERDKDKWFSYSNRIQKTPTLYWGYRVEDAGVLQILSKESRGGREKAESWIVLRQEDAEAIEYYGSMGFQIIVSDTLELLEYIGRLPEKKTDNQKGSSLSKNFPEFQMPPIESVPVRSLNEFYLGAEPVWYDIYSGKIHETSYFTSAKNAIAGNKNLILVGATLTGKTTLLKQLATRVAGFGTNLYIEEITPAKAKLLSRDVSNEKLPVTLFIDNIADAAEAIPTLLKNPDIRIVGAERDYIFDSVAHRFKTRDFTTFEIYGLSPIDIQAVEENIPANLQRRNFKYEQDKNLASNLDPTFFEIITSTIVNNSLVDRFIDALKNFKKTSPISHDLLLAACYCYHSRIPISLDIASAFCRSHSKNILEISNTLQSMNGLLSNYEGAYADTSQDYYVPRSRQVAESVLWKIPSIELKELLSVFHEEVSPARIGRYDIFRRTAYDADLVGRAFADWKEGLAFYEGAADRDHSYSLKQQCALYLAQKNNFELAFTWIDEALSMARNNAAIRNSYAVILFDANYRKATDDKVMASLDESMSLLKLCHDGDHRKVYHTKVFAEQAIKYSKKFPNSPNANIYLDISDQWLIAEIQKRPGDRRMPQLKRTIKSQIRALQKW